jgi:hypothetical protein
MAANDATMTDAQPAARAAPARARRAARIRVLDALEQNTFVVLVLAAVGALQAALSRVAIGSDSWYTLIGGRLVARSWLPHHDALTVFSAGRSWVDQQWLAHLVLYGLWWAGGWPLALLALLGAYVVAFAIAAAAARALGASERSTAPLLLACILLGITNSGFRAQTPAYVLFALVLLLLLRDERSPSKVVFAALPLLVVWANVHGSVVFGAGLVALRGLTVAVENVRVRAPVRRWLLRAASLAALPWLCTLASPYGLELPGYYHRILDNPTLSGFLAEWQPTTLKSQPFFFALLLVGLWLVFRQRGALGLFAQLALVAAGLGGLLALRNMIWFALVAAAVLPSALDHLWRPRSAPRHRRINLGIASAALLALVVIATATASHGRAWYEHAYPRAAGDAVASAAAADPDLRVFADGRYADWLLFDHPGLRGKVAYDVRYELLTAPELHRLFAFVTRRGNDWPAAARGYGLLVLDPSSEQGIADYYVGREHARVLYRDANVVVLQLPQTRTS